MKEQELVERVAGLLSQQGAGEEVLAAGVFNPRADGRRRPTRLIFGVERSRLDTRVHQRVNVRILELIDRDTGASVRLEGNRVPTLHTGDVLKALRDE